MRGEVIPMGIRLHVIEEEWEIDDESHSGTGTSQKANTRTKFIANLCYSLEWFGTKCCTPRTVPSNAQELFFLEKWQNSFSDINSSVKPNAGRTRTVVTLRSRELLIDVGFSQ
jgi:hypothetical protein